MDRELLERVEKMLTALEWIEAEWGWFCESCGTASYSTQGIHRTGCALAALLSDVRKLLKNSPWFNELCVNCGKALGNESVMSEFGGRCHTACSSVVRQIVVKAGGSDD
jgi:hypothetical protein